MTNGTGCRVLVVEDEAIVSMLIEDMLLDLGIEVVGPVSKMSEALELAPDIDADAAVLDINIGGQLTYPIADALQARNIPVVFATGYGAAALPERYRRTPTLHKPFNRQDFEAAISAALDNSACRAGAA